MSLSLPNGEFPHLRRIAANAKWVRDMRGTLRLQSANEFEILFEFLYQQGRLQQFMPRFRDDKRSLYSALAEVRTGIFLRSLGFEILRWEPPSPTGHTGDLLVQFKNSASIFVEVKSPDWEGELSDQERPARKPLGKHVHAESRWVNPVEMPFQVIRDNVLPKLTDGQPNIAVIVDDLFTSPAEGRGVIDGYVNHFFQDPKLALLGGILFLLPVTLRGGPVHYRSNFYPNPWALSRCQLPEPAVAALTSRATHDAALMNEQ